MVKHRFRINLYCKLQHMHQRDMIPPVRMDPVGGRAQFSPGQPVGLTGPSPTLAVWDWMGLIWTSPHMLAISTSFLCQLPLTTWLILTLITTHLSIPTLAEIRTVLSVYLVPSGYISPIEWLIQWTITLNLDTVLDWSKSLEASSVHVQTKSGLVLSRFKNHPDRIGLHLDGPGLDWCNAGLVESLKTHYWLLKPRFRYDTINKVQHRNLIWIYRWTRWGTTWQPAKFREDRSVPHNCTRVDGLHLFTTRTGNLAIVQFEPGCRPDLTIANCCQKSQDVGV
jgi:hypothetical protein